MASTRLVEYSGSSESEEDETEPHESAKDKRKNIENELQQPNNVKKIRKKSPVKELLPLPDDIKNLYKEKENLIGDDPAQHDGRIRSFPHLEGNWATHIFIEVELNEDLLELQQLLFSQLKPYTELKPMNHYHISLSKTVAIRHHWIQPLTDGLSKAFQEFSRTFCTFHSVNFFCNEEKTRTFLILEVNSNTDILINYIVEVDKVFKEFNLPPFYTNPSFHISIGWNIGNIIPDVPPSILSDLQHQVTNFLSEHMNHLIIPVDEIQCRTGNKLFRFPLKSSASFQKLKIHR